MKERAQSNGVLGHEIFHHKIFEIECEQWHNAMIESMPLPFLPFFWFSFFLLLLLDKARRWTVIICFRFVYHFNFDKFIIIAVCAANHSFWILFVMHTPIFYNRRQRLVQLIRYNSSDTLVSWMSSLKVLAVRLNQSVVKCVLLSSNHRAAHDYFCAMVETEAGKM